MAWSQYVNTDGVGYVQWVDVPLATACWQKADLLLGALNERTLNGRGWAAQRAALLEVAEWIARGARAVTVPLLYYPGYRDTAAAFTAGKVAFRAGLLRRVGETAGAAPTTTARIWFDEDSVVQTICMADDPRAGEACGGECVQAGATVGTSMDARGCDPADWNTMSWEVVDGVAYCVCPLRWTLELLRQLVGRLIAAGPMQVVQQTRDFTSVH